MTPQSWQWENGVWQKMAGIPLSDRGFRHGMSAFETVAVRNGKLILLAEHLEKLRQTCNLLGLLQPPQEGVFSELLTLPPSGTARLYITAGDGHFRAPLDNGRIFLLIEETSLAMNLESRSTPASLVISKTPHYPVWPSLKTGNYWPNIDAYRNSAETQSDEVVLVNASNHVISASLANLFAVIDGALLTPRVSSGARAGVMRDWAIAREEVIVSDFHPEQLRSATEIFLTNSGFGIAPIVTLEGKSLASQTLGQKIRHDFLGWLESNF